MFVLSLPSALLFEGRYFSGVLAGSLLGSLNLYFLALMVVRIMADKSDSSGKGPLIMRFMLKYVFIGILMLGAVFLFGCHPLGFAVGFSNIIFAILIDGLFLRRDGEKIQN